MRSLLCSAVLFDLDGVLVDSPPVVTRVWKGWAREHGFDPEHVIAVAHGRRAIETVRTVAPMLSPEQQQAEFEEVQRREMSDVEGIAVFDGAARLLRSLPPNRWGIVTSGTRLLATLRLRTAGLPVPKNLVTADDVENGKPDPEPYLKGAELLGVPPGQCVVIEDAPSGIRAARAAGMKAIGIPTTYPVTELAHADAVVARLADLSAELRGDLIELQFP